MIETLFSPATLLCISITFILSGLLFFYFKRSLVRLESAQMEHSRVLQSFISSMPPPPPPPSPNQNVMYRNINGVDVNSSNSINAIDSNSPTNGDVLIDVSDDDDSDSDSDSDSDDSDSDSDSDDSDSDDSDSDDKDNFVNVPLTHTATEDIINDISKFDTTFIPITSHENIKVVQMNNLEELSELPELHIDDIIQSLNTTDIDSDDDSSDDSTISGEHTNDANTNDANTNDANTNDATTNDANVINTDTSTPINYKNTSVGILRNLAEERNIIAKGAKPTKKEILQLLDNAGQTIE